MTVFVEEGYGWLTDASSVVVAHFAAIYSIW